MSEQVPSRPAAARADKVLTRFEPEAAHDATRRGRVLELATWIDAESNLPQIVGNLHKLVADWPGKMPALFDVALSSGCRVALYLEGTLDASAAAKVVKLVTIALEGYEGQEAMPCAPSR